jgi:hypothetical protein
MTRGTAHENRNENRSKCLLEILILLDLVMHLQEFFLQYSYAYLVPALICTGPAA